MRRLPRGLIFLDLGDNWFSFVVVKDLPPSLKLLYLGETMLEEQTAVLKLPLPQNMTLYVSGIDVVNLNGGQRQYVEYKCWKVTWEDGTEIKIRNTRLKCENIIGHDGARGW